MTDEQFKTLCKKIDEVAAIAGDDGHCLIIVLLAILLFQGCLR